MMNEHARKFRKAKLEGLKAQYQHQVQRHEEEAKRLQDLEREMAETLHQVNQEQAVLDALDQMDAVEGLQNLGDREKEDAAQVADYLHAMGTGKQWPQP